MSRVGKTSISSLILEMEWSPVALSSNHDMSVSKCCFFVDDFFYPHVLCLSPLLKIHSNFTLQALCGDTVPLVHCKTSLRFLEWHIAFLNKRAWSKNSTDSIIWYQSKCCYFYSDLLCIVVALKSTFRSGCKHREPCSHNKEQTLKREE